MYKNWNYLGNRFSKISNDTEESAEVMIFVVTWYPEKFTRYESCNKSKISIVAVFIVVDKKISH